MPKEHTRPVGLGKDGNPYGVTRVISSAHKARKKPCPSCPWRKDSEIGAFPAEAYRTSAQTAYDTAMTMFSCHESGSSKPAICAGFLLANAEHNMAVRLATMKGTLDLDAIGNPDGAELYESYRDMAIANGVDPDDPRIAPCRGNDEDGLYVHERIRRTGAYQPSTHEEYVRYLTDEDQADL